MPRTSGSKASASHSSSVSASDIRITGSGQIDERCSACRSGDVYFRQDGQLDGRCRAARQNAVSQNSDGSYDHRYTAVRDAPHDVNKQELTSADLRNPYAYYKFRYQDASENKSGLHADHIADLNIVAQYIKNTPGSLSQEALQNIKANANQAANFQMIDKQINMSQNNYAQHQIIKALQDPTTYLSEPTYDRVRYQAAVAKQQAYEMRQDKQKGTAVFERLERNYDKLIEHNENVE